jgi:Rps23 Pro-64 3,4-dihydroxylase Tpa1-like proline 4-hydroxylase
VIRLDPSLAAAWRAARPFPHVIVDGLLSVEDLSALRQAVAREPHFPGHGELYEHMASGEPMTHPTLRAMQDALGAPETLAAVAAITGRAVSRVDMRSYVYLAGSYLLPHTDHRPDPGDARQVAYAFYLMPGETFDGGALELFACDVEGGEIVATRPETAIAPRENRLVLFDVSPLSLHQVREVTRGGRVSLAGWFYPAR